ncbi:unnamed protein product [Pleuronectes platessa]|uniref:Uncharacterized protein n=1 Tax=Pleuronectes platessa TaxID=8262 RepID=A0A9N7YQH6_PLEPL|nr:unnamed protein product [Pleuronectes platessa]
MTLHRARTGRTSRGRGCEARGVRFDVSRVVFISAVLRIDRRADSSAIKGVSSRGQSGPGQLIPLECGPARSQSHLLLLLTRFLLQSDLIMVHEGGHVTLPGGHHAHVTPPSRLLSAASMTGHHGPPDRD